MGDAFQPEAVQKLTAALDNLCEELGVVDHHTRARLGRILIAKMADELCRGWPNGVTADTRSVFKNSFQTAKDASAARRSK
jgi:hypothetical protein